MRIDRTISRCGGGTRFRMPIEGTRQKRTDRKRLMQTPPEHDLQGFPARFRIDSRHGRQQRGRSGIRRTRRRVCSTRPKSPLRSRKTRYAPENPATLPENPAALPRHFVRIMRPEPTSMSEPVCALT